VVLALAVGVQHAARLVVLAFSRALHVVLAFGVGLPDVDLGARHGLAVEAADACRAPAGLPGAPLATSSPRS
jgi:hypothetical protein